MFLRGRFYLSDSGDIKNLVQFSENFFFTSFDLCEKFSRGCPPTQTPTQTIKSGFAAFSSQEIGSSLVSLEIIFEAPQSEPFRF